jgi:hypothetical protein
MYREAPLANLHSALASKKSAMVCSLRLWQASTTEQSLYVTTSMPKPTQTPFIAVPLAFMPNYTKGKNTHYMTVELSR